MATNPDAASIKLLAAGNDFICYANKSSTRYRNKITIIILLLLGLLALNGIPEIPTTRSEICIPGISDWQCAARQAAEEHQLALLKSLKRKNNIYQALIIMAILTIVFGLDIANLSYRQTLEGFLANGQPAASVEGLEEIVSEVRRLTTIMLSGHTVAPIYLERSDSSSPDVFALNSNYHLRIPAGFVVLWDQDRDSAIAVLAHEIGHIRNGDPNFHVHSEFAVSFLYYIAMPILAIIGIFGMILQTSIFLKPGWLISQWYLIRAAIHDVRDNRYWREHFADLCSCAFADATALLRHLSRLPSMPDSRTHPATHSRIEQVEGYRNSLVFWREPPSERTQQRKSTDWLDWSLSPSTPKRPRRHGWRPGQS